MEEKVVITVAREFLEARSESNDEEEIIDVVGGGEAKVRRVSPLSTH